MSQLVSELSALPCTKTSSEFKYYCNININININTVQIYLEIFSTASFLVNVPASPKERPNCEALALLFANIMCYHSHSDENGDEARHQPDF